MYDTMVLGSRSGKDRGVVAPLAQRNSSVSSTTSSEYVQAKTYLANLADFKLVVTSGMNLITRAGFTNLDIETARDKGRLSKFYPTLEKILLNQELSNTEMVILDTALKMGGLDSLYYNSVLRYNSERKILDELENFGFNLSSVAQTNSKLTSRELVFAKEVGRELINNINYSQTLVLPSQFEKDYEFNHPYYTIQNLIESIDTSLTADNLFNFYKSLDKLGLKDLVFKLNESPVFINDTKAREYVKSLESLRQNELFSLLRIVGVNDTLELPKELEHAYSRGITTPLRICNMYTAKAFSAIK